MFSELGWWSFSGGVVLLALLVVGGLQCWTSLFWGLVARVAYCGVLKFCVLFGCLGF